MGFFQDLFGPAQPCELCQLGQPRWPAAHNGLADWNIQLETVRVPFLVCGPCRSFLMQSGLMHKHPMLAMATLVGAGRAQRPPLPAYLQNEHWRSVWEQIIALAEKEVGASVNFMSAMQDIEAKFMNRGGAGEPEAPRSAPQPSTAGRRSSNSRFHSKLDARIEREGFPQEIAVPGGNPEITVPTVSINDARTDEERQTLLLTAYNGASHLLVSVIVERTRGALSIPIARGCALDMVMKGVEMNLAPSLDTEGFYTAGEPCLKPSGRTGQRRGIRSI